VYGIWIIGSHTVGVFSAAIPIAVAAVLIVREQAMLLGTIVAAIATLLGILPSLTPDIWPLIWNSHPIYFITDQIKLLAAVPVAVWIIRRLMPSKWIANGCFPVTSFGILRSAVGRPATDAIGIAGEFTLSTLSRHTLGSEAAIQS
jgi:hypothetical protein